MRLALLLLVSAFLRAQQYFPPGTFENEVRYSRFLQALHEPSLWELSQKDPKAEVYRFFWLRSFDHPISVRLVVRPSGSGWLYARMTSGKGGYEPGRFTRVSQSWATKGKTQSLLTAFESVDFWNLPVLFDDHAVHLDGADWIFEGVRDGRYHVIERWSPDRGDPLRGVGVLALKLARFRIREPEIY